MELKIEDVKIGTKLELVEEELQKATKPFVLGWLDYMRSQEEIIVTGLDGDMLEVNHSDDWGISDDSIGYFKKKEKPQQYTFDDLIDVAVQAYKDGAINDLAIKATCIEYIYNNEKYTSGSLVSNEGIEFIQSLYKETFVIECEDDINHVKSGAIITLLNGISLTAHDVFGNYIIVTKEAHSSYDFNILKGATVTQSK